jgi:hypothetical protein
MIRKRKTKLAHADGRRMRFRSAWKKTAVPTDAATRIAMSD